MERLIEVLYEETKQFRHCLITTHYRPWKEKLRWGWFRNGQCQLVELGKWTESAGLSLSHSVPDVQGLRQLLGETRPDPQIVCAKAGVILEAALDFITQLYECPVPRRRHGRHTLGDLLLSLDKKLRHALRVEVLNGQDASGRPVYNSISLAPLIYELTRIVEARNMFGCHFNELSFQMPEADALAFGREVVTLMNALTDDDTGWPRSGKSGSYWATLGETRRLHPLRQPG